MNKRSQRGTSSETSSRLMAVRKKMRAAGVDALIVRSTDRYLNEYVPQDESARVWISGFTGSMGEVVIARNRAYLAVDGRYWIQAENEIDPDLFEVVKVRMGTGLDQAVAQVLGQLAEKKILANQKLESKIHAKSAADGRSAKAIRAAKAAKTARKARAKDQEEKALRVGFEPDRISPSSLEILKSGVPKDTVWVPLLPSPVETVRASQSSEAPPSSRRRGRNRKKLASKGLARRREVQAREKISIWPVENGAAGLSTREKLDKLRSALGEQKADAVLVQRLDEIAYLANLRSNELPYQATFKAIALATPETLFVALDSQVPPEAHVRPLRTEEDGRSLVFVDRGELWGLVGKGTKRKAIAFDPRGNTEEARTLIEARGARIVNMASPVAGHKAIKTQAELEAMRSSFARADAVVAEAMRWLCREVAERHKRISEYDFAEKVEALFRESGATGLSFPVISAAGKNGAIIHYSDPSKKRLVRAGELMLLDTGAYYPEGFATDLTRTFLVGRSSDRGNPDQRRYYTLVLKGAIAGMRAVLPEGANGAALDAVVRAPLWRAGLDYAHGTGHGVGISVHEFPPRVSPNGATVLQENQVFSIEPGVYLPSFGGIRIENLCTLERIPSQAKRAARQSRAEAVGRIHSGRAPQDSQAKRAAQDSFLKVVPLTYCPLDRRLIEGDLLNPDEKSWLKAYAAGPSKVTE